MISKILFVKLIVKSPLDIEKGLNKSKSWLLKTPSCPTNMHKTHFLILLRTPESAGRSQNEFLSPRLTYF